MTLIELLDKHASSIENVLLAAILVVGGVLALRLYLKHG